MYRACARPIDSRRRCPGVQLHQPADGLSHVHDDAMGLPRAISASDAEQSTRHPPSGTRGADRIEQPGSSSSHATAGNSHASGLHCDPQTPERVERSCVPTSGFRSRAPCRLRTCAVSSECSEWCCANPCNHLARDRCRCPQAGRLAQHSRLFHVRLHNAQAELS